MGHPGRVPCMMLHSRGHQEDRTSAWVVRVYMTGKMSEQNPMEGQHLRVFSKKILKQISNERSER